MLARQGRYRIVADNLRIKEVRVDDGTARDRFVICYNPERAARDEIVRDEIIARLEEKIARSDELSATKGGCPVRRGSSPQRSPEAYAATTSF